MRTPTAEKLIRRGDPFALDWVANPSLVLEFFSYLARTSHWNDFFLTDGLIEEDETLFSRVG